MENLNLGFLAILPDLPLRIIASYLQFEDAIQFAELKPAWAHLQPTLQQCNGPDFDIRGPSYGKKSSFECNCNCNCSCSCSFECSCRGNCNCGNCICTAETYFDIPILSSGLSSISLSWQWKDQGWGNRKGQIWLKLLREDQEIADSRSSLCFCCSISTAWLI